MPVSYQSLFCEDFSTRITVLQSYLLLLFDFNTHEEDPTNVLVSLFLDYFTSIDLVFCLIVEPISILSIISTQSAHSLLTPSPQLHPFLDCNPLTNMALCLYLTSVLTFLLVQLWLLP